MQGTDDDKEASMATNVVIDENTENRIPSGVAKAENGARESVSREPTPAVASTPPPPLPANLPEKPSSGKRKRLPQDVIGRLEDDIAESPQDVALWKRLIEEMKRSDKLTELEEVYERMLKAFPTSAETWIAYIDLQLSLSEFQKVEQLFGRCLKKVVNINLWTKYLAYIRRRNDTNSGDEQKIQVVSQVYEFVLDNVGIDKDSGPVWLQYIDFIKGKTQKDTWEQQQKMDLLRKTYRKAIVIPTNKVESIWQSYNQFESGLNKQTARKFIAEKSAAYMTARSAAKELDKMFGKLDRLNTSPGPRTWREAEARKVQAWQKWIQWEKRDPLEAGSEVVKQRVWFAYQQAVLAMRYFSELWFEAVEYAIEIDKEDEALAMLTTALDANPSSFLLALKKAEMEEKRDEKDKMQATFKRLISHLQEERTKLEAEVDLNLNAKDVTAAYIMLMKHTNRSLGVKAARVVFGECRRLDYATHEIFTSSAKMEYYNNREKTVASKIFEVGLKRFSEDAEYIKQYFDFLVLTNDDTNARALFEKTVNKMTVEAAKPLYEHFMKYESDYGELTSLLKLEQRYKQLFPEADIVSVYAARNSIDGYSPIADIDLGQRRDRSSKPKKSIHVDSEDDDYSVDEPTIRPAKRAREDIPSQTPIFERAPSSNSLPQGISSLLKQLPAAQYYDTFKFDPAKLAKLIRDVQIPQSVFE